MKNLILFILLFVAISSYSQIGKQPLWTLEYAPDSNYIPVSSVTGRLVYQHKDSIGLSSAQTLSRTGDNLSISGGNTVSLPISIIIQSTAPSDTLNVWLNDSTGTSGIWTLEKYVNGTWSIQGYYDAVSSKFSQKKPLQCLCTGQSNMNGAVPVNPGDTTSDNRIVVWSETSKTWSAGGFSRNNPCLGFAKNYVDREDALIRIIHIAVGSQSISQWLTDSLMYDTIRNNISEVGWTSVDAILWHQGEADEDNAGVNVGLFGESADSNYLSYLYTVYEGFVNETWYDWNRPFVTGGLYAGTAQERNTALSSLNKQSTYRYIGFAEATGLSDTGDGIHFDGTAFDTLGQRYYNVFKYLPRQNPSDEIYATKPDFTGTYNYVYGNNAVTGRASMTGNSNIAFGQEALQALTSGSENIAIGTQTIENITTASRNTAIGYQAGQSMTSGNNNVAIGYLAGQEITTGIYNFALGSESEVGNTGARNTSIGFRAGYNTSSGTDNVYIGDNAGGANGTNNIGIGTNSGQGGTGNTSIGYQAGQLITTTSSNNVAIGIQALSSASSEIYENVAIGYNAMGIATGASGAARRNISIGAFSGYRTTSGDDNVMIGYNAGENISTGLNNTFVGYGAGDGITTGQSNVGIGYGALNNAGNNAGRIAIGYQAGDGDTESNYIAIGYQADVTASNQIVIGSATYTQLKSNNYAFNIDQSLAGLDGYALRYNSGSGEIELQADDAQTLSLSGDSLSISGGNTVVFGHNTLTTDSLTGSTYTADFLSVQNHIFQLDMTSAGATVTMTLNNPVSAGVYTFDFSDISTTQNIAWPSGVKDLNRVDLGTVTYSGPATQTLYYDGTYYIAMPQPEPAISFASDSITTTTLTIDLEYKRQRVVEVDMASATSVTLTVNNPFFGASETGVYTFHFYGVSGTDNVTWPSDFYDMNNTALGTDALTAGTAYTCYYNPDRLKYFCK